MMKELLLGMLLAQGGDLVTTGMGIQRGCQEAAILYRSMNYPTIVAVKGGAAVSLTWTLPKVRKTHPKTAKAVAWAVLASGTFATVWNARQLPRCRR